MLLPAQQQLQVSRIHIWRKGSYNKFQYGQPSWGWRETTRIQCEEGNFCLLIFAFFGQIVACKCEGLASKCVL